MEAVSALVTAGNTLRRNPAILTGMFSLTLILILKHAIYLYFLLNDAISTALLLSAVQAVVSVPILPFFTGGIYGMARNGLDGRTSLQDFLSEGQASYGQLVRGSLLKITISVVATVFGSIVVFVVVFIVYALSGTARGSTPPLQVFGAGGAGAAVILLLIAFLLGVLVVGSLFALPIIFFVQFYDAAIVIDNTRAFEGFRRSAELVRDNLWNTLGFSILSTVIWLLDAILLLYLIVMNLASEEQSAEGGAVLAGLLFDGLLYTLSVILFAFLLVIGAFFRVYKIVYYASIKAEE